MICENKHIRENGKFISLFTNAVACFILLNLSDFVGRRFMIVSNSILTILSLVLAYLLKPFYVKTFFLGLAYGCEGTFSSLFLFMMNEVTGTKN